MRVPIADCGWVRRRSALPSWTWKARPALLLVAALAAFAAVASLPSDAVADRAFGPRFTVNTQGDITIAANSILTCVDDPGGVCARARDAVGGAIPANNNNSRTMTWIDVDGDPATFDSSSAALSLPPGATVLFAGLYYGGRLTAGQGGSPPPNAGARNTVLFKAPSDASYRSLTASQVDDSSTQYQGFANVTGIVDSAGPGTYTTANVQLGTGLSDSTSGGWALVVAYGDPNAPSRNLSVFDGLQNVSSSGNVTIPLSGFQTPLTGLVTSAVGIVAYEGDLGTTGDGAQIQGASGFTALTNAVNPTNNVFNSTISNAGTFVTSRTPSFQNNLGYDADLFRTTGVLGNNQTSTQVRLTTSGDAYQPGVVTIATDLYAPKITATKTVDRATANLGDTLTYSIALQNSGQDASVGTTLKDTIPAGTVFVPGSIRVNGSPVTDGTGDDVGESAGGQVVARLGPDATAAAGGTLAPGAGATVSFQVTVATAGLQRGATIENTADTSFRAATTGVPSTVTSAPATTAVRVPDLVIGKSHSPALSPGQPSTYTITVGNVGDGPTVGAVTVTDTIVPPGLSINGPVTGAGWTCSIAGTTVTCARSDPLPANSDYPTISIPVLVSPSAQPGSLSNTASLTAPSDPDPDNNSFTDEGAVSEPAIDLHLEKAITSTPAVTPAGYVSGDTVTYRIEVTNNGLADAANVRLDDALDAPLVLDSLTPSRGSCAGTSCNLGTIAPGQAPVIVDVQAHVPGSFPAGEGYPSQTVLNNTATVSAPVGTEINPDDNGATASFTTLPVADTSITKTFSPAQPLAGGPVTYTLTVHNHGPGTVDTFVGDGRLPDALVKPPTSITISGGSGLCQFDPTGETLGAPPNSDFPVVYCNIPDFAPGEDRVITYTATLTPDSAGTPVTNNAFASGLIPLTDLIWETGDFADNVAAATFTPGSVNVGLTKSVVGPSTVAVGDTTTFRLVTSNSGTVAATDVVVTDPLPTGLEPVTLPAGCTAAGQTVTCAAGTLAPSESKTFDLGVRAEPAAAGQTLTNLATASSTEPDVDPADNSALANVTVGPFSVLSATKTASASSVPAGSRVTFTITVQNHGPSAAGGVNLTDLLPPGLTLRSITPSRGSCTGTSCDLGNFPAGASAQVSVVVETDASLIGKHVLNSVEVTAATPSSPAEATAPVDVTAPFAPPTKVDLAVDVRPPAGRVREGGTANFSIHVTNNGPATATNIRLTGTANRAVSASVLRLLQSNCSRLPLRCELGTLAPGQGRVFTVRVRRLVPGRLTLTASVTAAQTETNRLNNVDHASVQVRAGRTTLGLTKRAGAKSVQSDASVVFTIAVRNNGSIPARNLVVCDVLPEGLVFERLGGARLVDGEACWSVRRLAAGATIRYHVATRALSLPSARTLANVATVRGANAGRKRAQATVRLSPAAPRKTPVTG